MQKTKFSVAKAAAKIIYKESVEKTKNGTNDAFNKIKKAGIIIGDGIVDAAEYIEKNSEYLAIAYVEFGL